MIAKKLAAAGHSAKAGEMSGVKECLGLSCFQVNQQHGWAGTEGDKTIAVAGRHKCQGLQLPIPEVTLGDGVGLGAERRESCLLTESLAGSDFHSPTSLFQSPASHTSPLLQ